MKRYIVGVESLLRMKYLLTMEYSDKAYNKAIIYKKSYNIFITLFMY